MSTPQKAPSNIRRIRASTRRTFDRNGYIGFRLPLAMKTRAEAMAGRRHRDLSALVLDWFVRALEREEQVEIARHFAEKTQTGASNG
jgi:hypothetical protein